MNLSTLVSRLSILCCLLSTVSLSSQTAQSFTDIMNGMTAPIPTASALTVKEFGNCTFYDNLAEFQAACGSELAIEDFEGSGVIMMGFLSCSNLINGESENCFSFGEVTPGFDLSSPGSTLPNNQVLFMLGSGITSRVTSDMIGNNDFDTPLEITFQATDITAISFDLTTEFIQGDVQIDIYDLNDNLVGTSIENTMGTESKFVAMSTPNPVRRIVINSLFNGVEIIDNLSFGACRPIPTMGQWSKLILGMSLASIALMFIYRISRNSILA